MRTNFDNYRFRCSSLGKLMTNPQKKTETLSQTTKSYLLEIFNEEIFNKSNEIVSKYLDKGIQVEEDSIQLYERVKGTLVIKNEERKFNDFIIGTPDSVGSVVRDFKSSWNINTFPMFDTEIPNKQYYWQLQGYMELWNIDHAELIYCLVDTPEMLIEDEKRRTSWKLGMIELPIDLEAEIDNNMRFQTIPEYLRVKVFNVERNKEDIEQLYSRIADCKAYLNGLLDNLANGIL